MWLNKLGQTLLMALKRLRDIDRCNYTRNQDFRAASELLRNYRPMSKIGWHDTRLEEPWILFVVIYCELCLLFLCLFVLVYCFRCCYCCCCTGARPIQFSAITRASPPLKGAPQPAALSRMLIEGIICSREMFKNRYQQDRGASKKLLLVWFLIVKRT